MVVLPKQTIGSGAAGDVGHLTPPIAAALLTSVASGNLLLHAPRNYFTDALVSERIIKSRIKAVGRKRLLQLHNRVSGRKGRLIDW
jgi:hypothetical protein